MKQLDRQTIEEIGIPSPVLMERAALATLSEIRKAGYDTTHAIVICAKGKYHTLIDCKVISTEKGFPLRRAEMNQRSAMNLFQRRAAELCWFAFRLPDMSVWMMSIGRILAREKEGMTHLSEKVIREQALTLEAWLKETEVWSKDI